VETAASELDEWMKNDVPLADTLSEVAKVAVGRASAANATEALKAKLDAELRERLVDPIFAERLPTLLSDTAARIRGTPDTEEAEQEANPEEAPEVEGDTMAQQLRGLSAQLLEELGKTATVAIRAKLDERLPPILDEIAQNIVSVARPIAKQSTEAARTDRSRRPSAIQAVSRRWRSVKQVITSARAFMPLELDGMARQLKDKLDEMQLESSLLKLVGQLVTDALRGSAKGAVSSKVRRVARARSGSRVPHNIPCTTTCTLHAHAHAHAHALVLAHSVTVCGASEPTTSWHTSLPRTPRRCSAHFRSPPSRSTG
jgi:hypothetical protein